MGGDKPLPYLPAPQEDNPFLGERGIRFTFAHSDVLRTQLRALLRASTAGRLAIMFPMISELDQVLQARALFDEVRAEVGGTAEVGIMVEVPAAALIADRLAQHVDFFSCGTNDLVQYTLAVDRVNDRIAPLYHPLHPAVLRLLASTAQSADARGLWSGVCGEMAGDMSAIPILLGLGFTELSVTPARLPEAKERIRSLDYAACRELAARAIELSSSADVESLVDEALVHGREP